MNTSLPRYVAILLVACVSFIGAGVSSALAQGPAAGTAATNPELKNGVTIVVNLLPGGITDTAARALQPYLQAALGVPVRVQNMPGGGGNTAAQYVYHLGANQPVIMMSTIPQLTIGQLIGDGDYETLRYTPLSGVFGEDTAVFIAKAGSPYKHYSDLVHATKPIVVGLFGVKSSATWLSTEFLRIINHINIQAIPFANGIGAADAVLGGSVDLASVTRSTADPLIQQGRVQVVLHFAPRRIAYLSRADSIVTVGGKASEAFTSQLGLLGPPGMPAAVVSILEEALAKAVTNSGFKDESAKVGLSVIVTPILARSA